MYSKYVYVVLSQTHRQLANRRSQARGRHCTWNQTSRPRRLGWDALTTCQSERIGLRFQGMTLEEYFGSYVFFVLVLMIAVATNAMTIPVTFIFEYLWQDPSYISRCTIGFTGRWRCIDQQRTRTFFISRPGGIFSIGLSIALPVA